MDNPIHLILRAAAQGGLFQADETPQALNDAAAHRDQVMPQVDGRVLALIAQMLTKAGVTPRPDEPMGAWWERAFGYPSQMRDMRPYAKAVASGHGGTMQDVELPANTGNKR